MSPDAPTAKLQPIEAIKQGWHVFKQNFNPIFVNFSLVILFSLVCALLFQFINVSLPLQFQNSGIVNIIFAALLGAFKSIAVVNTSLKSVRGGRISTRDLYQRLDLFLPMFSATVLYSLSVSLAAIFIIPVLIVLPRLFLYDYLILDRGDDSIKALKDSWKMVRGSTWQMLGLIVMLALLNLAGVLCFGIGFLFTYPVTALASAAAYEQLSANLEEKPPGSIIDIT
jgi:hypothetical protein